MENRSGDLALSESARFWRRTLTDLAIMTVIGVFLAILGPFGSIAEPLPVRLVTWLAFAYLGYLIYSPMGYWVDRAHAALALPTAPLWFVAVVIGTVPMTVLIYFIQFMPRTPPLPTLDQALTSYFYVFVIGGAITLLFNVLGRYSAPDDSAQHQGNTPPQSDIGALERVPNPLLDQLPPALGIEVIALEMEDHYVRVHTALGSEMVLMRLRDAMVHVGEIEGRQVHRSWWVARLAVEDVRREGRNIRLVLPGGLEAPVARAQVSELKAAGWL